MNEPAYNEFAMMNAIKHLPSESLLSSCGRRGIIGWQPWMAKGRPPPKRTAKPSWRSRAGLSFVSVGSNKTETVAQTSLQTVGMIKLTNVGMVYSQNVGLAMNTIVGLMKAEQVGMNKNVIVGKDYDDKIGGDRGTKISGSEKRDIGKSKTEAVGKNSVTTANDHLELTCGSASIVLSSDGGIYLKGTHVEVIGNGAVNVDGGIVKINDGAAQSPPSAPKEKAGEASADDKKGGGKAGDAGDADKSLMDKLKDKVGELKDMVPQELKDFADTPLGKTLTSAGGKAVAALAGGKGLNGALNAAVGSVFGKGGPLSGVLGEGITSILGGAAQGALAAHQAGKPIGQGALDGARKPAETVVNDIASGLFGDKPATPTGGSNPTSNRT